MKLIVAEKSDAAKQIANILGKPKQEIKNKVNVFVLPDAFVVPLRGHIVDVDFPEKYSNWVGTALPLLVDSEIKYKTSLKNIESTLQYYAKQADTCIIATDFDREGESIGKEALDIIRKVNPKIKVKRAKYSAFTRKEITDAFTNLVDFDENLADSADARREIDLIWGAVLTRFISIAAKRLGKSFLSVGRVQTPTLALAVDREKEIQAFKPEDFWELSIDCKKDKDEFRAMYEEDKIFDSQKAERLSKLTGKTAQVLKVEKKQVSEAPPTPFSTTDFLRASASVGIQPGEAMKIGESLYTAGYISYPRTDNTHYPESLDLRNVLKILSESKELGDMAKKLLLEKQLEPTKGKKKTTDHPPIYPVSVVSKTKLGAKEWKIYELIVRRFYATLAKPAILNTVKADLDYSKEHFIARGKTIKEPGWKEFYIYSKTKEEELPELKEKEIVDVLKLNCEKKQTKPKPRYSPAALIKLMEELGLGTKATRAEILQKLIDRGYLSGKKNFTPSEIAFAMIDSMQKYASQITKPEMTAKLEEEMNKIEQGALKKVKVVDDSRKMLSGILQEMSINNNKIADALRGAANDENILCECPKCNKQLRIIRTKKGTRFVGCTGYVSGCNMSFPLPALGKIVKLDKLCEKCNLPVIRVINGKRYYDMCINHLCESKKDWTKKKPAEVKPVGTAETKKSRKPRAKKEEVKK